MLIETSGVADPGRLLVSLRDPHLRLLSRVDGVITLVDSGAIDTIPASAQELARRQLANADLIVFNKTDLVSREAVAALRERLTYPRARIVEAENANVPLELVLGVLRPDDGGSTNDVVAGGHSDSVATWTWTSTQPLAYEAVRDVLSSLPVGVFRAKGFVHLAEAPDDRVVAHVVGRRVDLRPLGDWGSAPPRTELVFISLDGAIDEATLRSRLAATARKRTSMRQPLATGAL